MLLGASTALAGEVREEVAGTVEFVFRHGEESCGGAERMLTDGLLDKPVGRAFDAAHPMLVGSAR
ncbi:MULTISPECIES: hypothetical protein [Streptomyces]|uniref:hypothetical protein n=1 Tax=Streptomyces sp. NBC_01525 TaxID=2903893 RepID=UPI00203643D2|nr:hypothetical protein [Streptomyces benahoarensis]